MEGPSLGLLEKLRNLNLKQLGDHNPELKRYIRSNKLDLSDPNALRELVETQFSLYLGVEIKLPKGNLVPRLANRLDYLIWMSELAQPAKTALDIGVGATCVFPLLASRLGVQMHGTDVDKRSINEAEKLGLGVKLLCTGENDLLEVLNDIGEVDFTVCNPPFYADKDDLNNKTKLKENSAPSITPLEATESELYTKGGELGFALRLLESSAKVPNKARWFSVLLSTKSNLDPLLKAAKECAQTKTHTITQGKTRRYILAWTFQPTRRIIYKGDIMDLLDFVDTPKQRVLQVPGIIWSRRFRRQKAQIGSPTRIEFKDNEMRLLKGDPKVFESLYSYLVKRIQKRSA